MGSTSSRLHVGEYFQSEMGFVRRVGVNKTFANLRFSPRSRSILVRKYFVEGLYSNISRATTGQSESRDVQLTFRTQFQSSDQLNLTSITRPSRSDALSSGPRRHPCARLLRIQSTNCVVLARNQRPVYGSVGVTAGRFYSGQQRAISYTGGRMSFTRSSRLSRPSISTGSH